MDLLYDYKTPVERTKEIAQRERVIRKRKKITQEQMASRIGVSLSTLNDLRQQEIFLL